MKAVVIFLVVIFCFVAHTSSSQDTLDIQNVSDEIDTVVIYKEPVVLRQTVFVKVKAREKEVWMELAASPFYTVNHYKACPGFEAYLTELKSSTTTSTGYYFGGDLIYFRNNFLFSVGLGYSIFREKFSKVSLTMGVSRVNTYNYLSIPVTAGYRVVKRNKFQLILSTGAVVSKLSSLKGMTIAEENVSEIKNINEVRKYYSYNYHGLLKAKLVFPLKEKLYVGVEPYYMLGMGSVTKSLEPFTQTRNMVGVNADLIFVFK